MNKIASELVKLSKVVVAGKRQPLTAEEQKWYKRVLAHLKGVTIDPDYEIFGHNKTFDKVKLGKQESSSLGNYIVIEAEYDDAWITVEVIGRENKIYASVSFDAGSEAEDIDAPQIVIRGINFDKPNETIKLIDKAVAGAVKALADAGDAASSEESQRELGRYYDYGRHK